VKVYKECSVDQNEVLEPKSVPVENQDNSPQALQNACLCSPLIPSPVLIVQVPKVGLTCIGLITFCITRLSSGSC